ncbi:MAG: bifunctional glutamate N-acetyltransferase/amino-acid acetyltransferase ArgJ, partial [Clostridiales bacterium]|nr:bifunctional glutamate N-acetyltransferase/amino-acid acetyltransferase ArgJ [Clostridiales bacterium]
RAHLADGYAQAMVCNSGNANTCNADGIDVANEMCRLVAAAAGVPEDDVIVASTGVIGQPLPMEPIARAMPGLAAALSADGAQAAAEAIMTTDLRVKQIAVEADLGGVTARIGAMAKGSGMIQPNMATMLCFVTTDAAISPSMLHKALFSAVDETFNMVSVDGDTSTNDMVAIMASGLAGNAPIDAEGPDFAAFASALRYVLEALAREVARDGEGATKLITCRVTGAPDQAGARAVAKAVVNSPLVKTMMFGADANSGRIMCAIGYAPSDFAVDRVEVRLASRAGEIAVCRDGFGLPFNEAEAKKILLEKDIDVHIALNQGTFGAVAWGCDLTYDYVKINGDYRS